MTVVTVVYCAMCMETYHLSMTPTDHWQCNENNKSVGESWCCVSAIKATKNIIQLILNRNHETCRIIYLFDQLWSMWTVTLQWSCHCWSLHSSVSASVIASLIPVTQTQLQTHLCVKNSGRCVSKMIVYQYVKDWRRELILVLLYFSHQLVSIFFIKVVLV